MKKQRIYTRVLAMTTTMALAFSSVTPSAFTLKADAISKTETKYQVMPFQKREVTVPVYKELSKKPMGKRIASLAKEEEPLPLAFDSKKNDYITSVKNQHSTGTCWAFASIAALETAAIVDGTKVNGKVADRRNLDLSERHLAYFTYHTVNDRLGGFTGDKVTHVKQNYLSSGGSELQAAFTLASWRGAVDEKEAPFTPFDTLSSAQVNDNKVIAPYDLDNSQAYANNAVQVKDFYGISLKNADLVKREIMERGAAVISFGADFDYGFNEKTNSFYTTQPFRNHEVCLIGWDDTFNRYNFKSSNRPAHNGAWVVKNSWGTSNVNGGYYYISYEDVSIEKEAAYFYKTQETGTYDNNYQYDGNASNFRSDVQNGGMIGNHFVVPADASQQTLKAVSVGVNTTNVEYSIQIYKGAVNYDPTKTEPQLEKEQTGLIKYAGYYTIPLEETVALAPGDEFTVMIKLTALDGDSVEFYADGSRLNDEYDFVNSMREGGSYKYVVSNGGGYWMDLKNCGPQDNFTPRIKAFTVNDTETAVKNRCGDFNGDGTYSYADARGMDDTVKAYQKAVAEGVSTDRYYEKCADLDMDGDLDQDDVSLFRFLFREAGYQFLGDHDGNHVYTSEDLMLQYNAIQDFQQAKESGEEKSFTKYDLDKDGYVDEEDYGLLVQKVTFGDFDEDGKATASDVTLFYKERDMFSQAQKEDTYYYNIKADLDLDGDIDRDDVSLLKEKVKLEAWK